MGAFLVALQFLTRLASPLRGEVSREQVGASIAWFPVVGGLIGAMLVLLDRAAGAMLARPVVDALLVAALVAITGALHLDGLVDCVDGLVAGPDGAARLAAMRESTAGNAGAIAACAAILATFVALGALDSPVRTVALVLAPLQSRAAIVLAYWRYPYGREDATVSQALKEGATTHRALASLGTATVLTAAIGGLGGLALLSLAAVVTVAIARLALARLPGLTGDVYGAICETSQLAIIVCAPLALRA